MRYTQVADGRTLLRPGPKARILHSLDHLFDDHDALLIGHAGELLPETYFSTPDTLQPLQGLLDHKGSGPSRHAVDPQVGDGSL